MKLSAREQQKLADLRDTVFEGQLDLYELLGEEAPEAIAGEEVVKDLPNTDTPYQQ